MSVRFVLGLLIGLLIGAAIASVVAQSGSAQHTDE